MSSGLGAWWLYVRSVFYPELPVALRTELPLEECVARLGRTAWTGKARPGQWQPIQGDLDVFRRVKGNTFRLDARPTHRNKLIESALSDDDNPQFYGRLEDDAAGTRICGRFGSSEAGRTKTAATLLVPLFGLAFPIIAVLNIVRGSGAVLVPLLMGLVWFVSLAVSVVGLASKSGRRYEGMRAEGEYVVGALSRLLEARPADDERAG